METDELTDLYRTMLRIRHFEEKVSQLYAEGEISGLVHTYVGEEAVAAGACKALEGEDNIVSTHRGHGHSLAMGTDSKEMMAEILGKETGINRGRGGSMHIVDLPNGVICCTGIAGAGVTIGTGVALASQVKDEGNVTLSFFGDGASNTGAFHEGINLASVWDLPIVFICENNRYAISVPTSKSLNIESVAERAHGYGIPGESLDGMDCTEVHDGVSEAVERARNGGGPTLLEFNTYRYHGHYEGEPFSYRPKEEVEKWKVRDPIERMRNRLLENGCIDEAEDEKIREEIKTEMEEAANFAEESNEPDPSNLSEGDLFAPSKHSKSSGLPEEEAEGHELDCSEAIVEALREEMERDEDVVVFGEDVGEIGGLFGCTRGLQDEFGRKRVRDTPISEEAITGSATGAALAGLRPVGEIEFIDFITRGMDGLCNQMAKLRLMSGGKVKLPAVIRAASGSRHPVASGAAQHSQSLSAWFMHIPGLKVVTFSTPYDAKGLLKASIRDDNPVLFVEHKLLYYAKRARKIRERWPKLVSSVPQEEYTIPLGEADIKREGKDVTLVASMFMIHKSLNVAEKLEKDGISVEVIDPRSLVPLDDETIVNSVKKTGKCVVVSEDCRTGGIGAEISSIVAEEATYYLEAPIKRVGALDMPIPYSPHLEGAVIPLEEDIEGTLREIV